MRYFISPLLRSCKNSSHVSTYISIPSVPHPSWTFAQSGPGISRHRCFGPMASLASLLVFFWLLQWLLLSLAKHFHLLHTLIYLCSLLNRIREWCQLAPCLSTWFMSHTMFSVCRALDPRTCNRLFLSRPSKPFKFPKSWSMSGDKILKYEWGRTDEKSRASNAEGRAST